MRDETHTFAYTEEIIGELDAAARMKIEKLGGNAGLMAILDRLRIDGTGDQAVI